MREFCYLAPHTVSEAVALRCAYGNSAVVLNGGTDVVIQMRERLLSPDYVIDIKHIEALHGIRFSEEQGLTIGACATVAEVSENAYVKAYYPFLSEAAGLLGSKQVRNRATLAGNIINASPLCDLGTPLYAAEAFLTLVGEAGERTVPIEDFITFVRRTSLRPDEIVTSVHIPYHANQTGAFYKLSRRREVDLSTVCGTLIKDGDVFRIALGAVAPTPVRLKKTEQLLREGTLDRVMIEQAAALALTEIAPIDDIRASKQYRQDMAVRIVRNGLSAFLEVI